MVSQSLANIFVHLIFGTKQGSPGSMTKSVHT